jgi:hypothetical protein
MMTKALQRAAPLGRPCDMHTVKFSQHHRVDNLTFCLAIPNAALKDTTRATTPGRNRPPGLHLLISGGPAEGSI